MTSTAATRISHDQQPGRSDMDEHQREEYLRTAYRAADQEWRPVDEAAHRPSPEDLAAACDRARDAALAALTEAGLDGDGALALAERAARQQDDESEVPVHYASRYPAQVGSISWHLLADGYTITWAPAPAGCSLTLDRHGPRGEHAAYRGGGPTMQRAWDEVRAQLGHGGPQAAASGTREAPGSERGSDRLYRVVQYYGRVRLHRRLHRRLLAGNRAGRPRPRRLEPGTASITRPGEKQCPAKRGTAREKNTAIRRCGGEINLARCSREVPVKAFHESAGCLS